MLLRVEHKLIVDIISSKSQVEAQSADRLEEKMAIMSVTVADVFQTVHKLQAKMPKALGYPWEGDIASSHVHLEDVLGRSVLLPTVLCRTFKSFHDTLKIMFSDHPGFGKVSTLEYEIIDETNNRTVFPGRAKKLAYDHGHFRDTSILPGTKLLMSIQDVVIIEARKDALASSVQTSECCLNCEAQTFGRNFRKWYVMSLSSVRIQFWSHY